METTKWTFFLEPAGRRILVIHENTGHLILNEALDSSFSGKLIYSYEYIPENNVTAH